MHLYSVMPLDWYSVSLLVHEISNEAGNLVHLYSVVLLENSCDLMPERIKSVHWLEEVGTLFSLFSPRSAHLYSDHHLVAYHLKVEKVEVQLLSLRLAHLLSSQ